MFAHSDEPSTSLRSDGHDIVEGDNIELLKDCATTDHRNTGHIVLVTGPARYFPDDDEWRVPLVQSTGASNLYKGVQHGYRRFKEKNGMWIKEPRPMDDVKDESTMLAARLIE
jgi:hypothetical protein